MKYYRNVLELRQSQTEADQLRFAVAIFLSLLLRFGLVVTRWLSGNALASINVVALRQTRLVLGWVTVCGRVNHFGM